MKPLPGLLVVLVLLPMGGFGSLAPTHTGPGPLRLQLVGPSVPSREVRASCQALLLPRRTAVPHPINAPTAAPEPRPATRKSRLSVQLAKPLAWARQQLRPRLHLPGGPAKLGTSSALFLGCGLLVLGGLILFVPSLEWWLAVAVGGAGIAILILWALGAF